METLKAMFPDIDEDFLQEVLSSTQNDVERAVDWLLSGGMSSLPKNPVQDKPDGIPDDEPGKPAAPPKAKFESISTKPVIRRGLSFSINDPTFADVLLVCRDGEILAHQVILCARSEYFFALLSSIIPDGENLKRLELEDADRDIVMLLLEYLYTDRVTVPEAKAHQLYLLANNLGIMRLRKLCEGITDSDDSTFHEDFVSAMNNADLFSDVTLMVEGKPVFCHRLMLTSSCEYFKGMFMGGMAEVKKSTIPLEDVSYNSFLILLEVIYRDGKVTSGKITTDNAVELFLAANRLIFPSLQTHCEDIISNNIDEDNVAEVVEMAWNSSSTLRHVSLQFLFSNWEAAIKTDAYKALPEQMKLEIQQRYQQESENALANLIRAVSDKDVDDIVGSIRMEVYSFLTDQLDEMTLDDEEGVTDSPIGEINFSLSNLTVHNDPDNPFLRPENIEVTFGHKQLTIRVDKLRVEMKNMKWEYEQQSFPHLHDDGEASCQISDIKIALVFDIASTSIGIPSLSVNNFDISIGKFDLKIKGTKAKILYAAFVKLFGDRIKKEIREGLMSMFNSTLEELTRGINKLSADLVGGDPRIYY